MIEHDLTPQERAELGDLSPLYAQLDTYNVAAPNSQALLEKLKPLLNTPRQEEAAIPLPQRKRKSVKGWLRFAWMQIEFLEAPFWWSTLIMFALGLLLQMSFGTAITTLCLVFASPVIAAAGVAYIFRPATRTLWELEILSDVQPLQLLYARLGVILGINIGLSSLLFLVVSVQSFQLVLWRLLLLWFGPMIGLVGIALFCAVRWNALIGIVAPLLTWGGLLFFGWREVVWNSRFEPLAVSQLVTQIAASNTLSSLALACFIGGVLLLIESGRLAAR